MSGPSAADDTPDAGGESFPEPLVVRPRTARGRRRLAHLDAYPFAITLRVPFRRTTVRRGILLHGPAGWGEFSPFPEYEPSYTRRWLDAAVEAATVVDDGMRHRDRVAVNLTVPAMAPEDAARRVGSSPARTVKVKVAEPGQGLADDLDRVAAVRDALLTRPGPAAIRVDANAAWTVDEAADAIGALARVIAAPGHGRVAFAYAEQPVATIAEMAALRRRIDVPIAADEVIRTAADPEAVALADAADVVVLKVQPLGGIGRAMAVAEAAGLHVVVSSALETSVGIARGVAFGALLPPDLGGGAACGLGTVDLFEADVVDDPIVMEEDGAVAVRRPTPSPERLRRVTVDDPTARTSLAEWLAAAADA